MMRVLTPRVTLAILIFLVQSVDVRIILVCLTYVKGQENKILLHQQQEVLTSIVLQDATLCSVTHSHNVTSHISLA
jgi:hypothetical protein